MYRQRGLSKVQHLFVRRWHPTKMNYKGMLKDGKGTDFIVKDIAFDVAIPVTLFNKAMLRK